MQTRRSRSKASRSLSLNRQNPKTYSPLSGAQITVKEPYNCGQPSCGKPVRSGIECTHCRNWHHPTCAQMSTQQIREHMENPTKPWFCSTCNINPIIRSIVAVTNHYESLLNSLRAQLTQGDAPTGTSSPTQPAKRMKLHNVPSHPQAEHTQDYGNSKSQYTPPAGVKTYASAAASATNKTQLQPEQEGIIIVTPQKQPAKSPPAPGRKTETKKQQETLTVICTNIPEPTSTSLATRREEEMQRWSALCKQLGTNVKPTTLTRLSRKKDSPHAGEPRLLRVTLEDMSDVETILLASYLLKETGSTRIYPDIPWTERVKRQAAEPHSAAEDKNKRAILIHGVPELEDTDKAANHLHDCGEWSYIQQLLELDNTLATDVFRLPRSPNYRGSGPRILKVTLLNTTMVTAVLDAWYQHKHKAPELRIRPTVLPTNRAQTETEPTKVSKITPAIEPPASFRDKPIDPSRNRDNSPANSTTQSKNSGTPALMGPEHSHQ